MKKTAQYLKFGISMAILLLLNVGTSKATTVDATLLFNPASNSTTTTGSNVTYTARVNPGSNTVNGTNAVQMDITFVPAVVHLVSLTPVAPFSIMTPQDIASANSTGKISVSLFIPGGQVTTTSDLATLVFSPQGAGNNSQITFDNTSDVVEAVTFASVLGTRTGATVTVTAPDATAPAVTAFTLPASPASSTIAISSFTATDNVAVTAWMVKETATNVAPTAPTSGSAGWQTSVITGTTSASIAGNVAASTPGMRYFWAYVKDAAGNVSAVSASQAVTVPDTTPPVLSVGLPAGTLAAGTTQATVSFTTDENAICAYASTLGVAYDSMTNFILPLNTAHSFTATNLANGNNYAYFVRCKDANNNANISDYLISFSVANPAEVKKSSSHNDSKKSTPDRTITNSKSDVKNGQILTQRGKKFSKNSIVLLYFSKFGGTYYAPVKIKTSSTGSFMTTYRVNKPKGTYTWYVVDPKTGKKSKIVHYHVKL